MNETRQQSPPPHHILIVEDSAIQAEVLRRILVSAGYLVTVARNGAEGLIKAFEIVPTLVVSDILMPKMDGIELCRKIKSEPKLQGIPVILLTMLTNTGVILRGLESGADNFITKPYEADNLLTHLATALSDKTDEQDDTNQQGTEILYEGKSYLISADRRQVLNTLLTTYETAIRKNDELLTAQEVMRNLNEELEQKVRERTAALTGEIEERKRAEDALHQALAAKETLIRELYHRTKNNMQIVRSLMNIQAGDAGAETRAIIKEMDNRIQGLSLVHQMLYQSGDLSNLDITEYLDSLVRIIVRNFWGHHPTVTVIVSGEPLSVTLDIATPCGLVLNELLSNAFKYAFPDGRHGAITIRLFRDGPEHIRLEYADNGVGLPEGFDPRNQETLGMQSIYAIVEQQLQGEVQVKRGDGLGFVLRIAIGHYQERV